MVICNYLGTQAIGGIFNTLVQTEDHGHRVLIEQAVHEIKRGSYSIALRYLDKALSVILSNENVLITSLYDFEIRG